MKIMIDYFLLAQTIFEEYKAKVKSDVKLVLHDNDYDYIASYDPFTHTIHLDVGRVLRTDFYFQFGVEMLEEEYIHILLAHEFGHVKDRKGVIKSLRKERQLVFQLQHAKSDKKKEKIISKLVRQFRIDEEVARKNGQVYVEIPLRPLFHHLNEQAIKEGIFKRRLSLRSVAV